MSVTIYAAVARNRTIGLGGKLPPWKLEGDLPRFKERTMGKALVLGRKTYESFGKPLPGRKHFVISRNLGYQVPDEYRQQVVVCHSLAQAIQRAEALGLEVCVVGGEEVYREAIPVAARMELTEVDTDYEGDAFFPDFDQSNWRREVEPKDGFAFVTYYRIKPG